MYVQCVACLEGPVCENYENEIKTIGNDKFPIQQTIQSLCDDTLYTFVLSNLIDNLVSKCLCFVFKPIPASNPCTARRINVKLRTNVISEYRVTWSCTLLEGTTPEVPVPVSTNCIEVSLVTKEDNDKHVIGLSFYFDDFMIAAWKLGECYPLDVDELSTCEVQCCQISGHLSNDGKQVNILTGQASCAVGYPMPCCLASKQQLGIAPEWIQRRTMRMRILESVPQTNGPVVLPMLPDSVIDSIGKYWGHNIRHDAPKREGELSFENTHAVWAKLNAGGRVKKSAAEHKKDNARTGSSFYPPIFNFPSCKQNGGIMHTPCGHTTHFWQSVSREIREYMSGKEWEVQMSLIGEEVMAKIKEISILLKEANTMSEIKVVKRDLFQVRKKLNNVMTQECEHKELIVEEDRCRTTLSKLVEDLDFGTYNLIQAGLREFEVILKARPKKESKRAQSDLEFALWKTIESRAGGKLDMRNSGQE